MRLTEFVSTTTWNDLPGDVRHMAKRCLLDLVGVAAAGVTTPLSQAIRDHAASQFGGTGARMLFDGRRVSPVGAALAGGMTIDSIDAHDGHPLTKGHTGCGLFPALLAMAEAEEAPVSGEEFLTRLALGYEVAIRAGMALHASAADYHTSGAWVAVGIAVLGGRSAGLTDEQLAHAMGIAEYHGPRSPMMRAIDAPTMVKDGSGWGAMAGVSAIYLARSGFTGAPAAIVGEDGDIWGDLGQRWRILEQYFKPWPVCRWAQPAVEAALALRAAHDVAASEIRTIRVRSFHEARRLATARPVDTEQAQYSLPFPVAAALTRGKLGMAEICGESLRDEAILSLADRVQCEEASWCNERFPAERWAEVELEMRDGTVLRSEPTTARGDAMDPLSDDALTDKFEAFVKAAGVGDQTLGRQIWALDEAPDITGFIEAVT